VKGTTTTLSHWERKKGEAASGEGLRTKTTLALRRWLRRELAAIGQLLRSLA